MSAAKILVVILIVGSVMLWAQPRGGAIPVIRCLPLLGGYAPSVCYDGAGLVLVGLGIWGWSRLGRRSDDPE